MTKITNKIGNAVIGTWTLVAWYHKSKDGERVNYFGDNPKGILTYDPSGYMSVHIMKEDRKPFKAEGMYDGTDEEIVAAFKSYFAYYGTYVEEEPGILTHTVQGGLFPGWVGNMEKRYAKIEGDKLIIYTPPIPTEDQEIVFYIEWERVQ